MRALARIGRTVCGALIFGFSWQPQASPRGVRRRLRVTDIDRPRHRQWHELEHPAPQPIAMLARPLPECGSPDAGVLQPRPVLGPPPAGIVVAACVDELEKRGIRDIVALYRER